MNIKDIYFTQIIGTLVPNQPYIQTNVTLARKHFPTFSKKIQKGKIELSCSSVLASKWKDKRDVHMITSFHDGRLQDSGKIGVNNEPIRKPNFILDYTRNMRLVDKADMQLATVECVRKSIKWYNKAFFHMVDLTILNCYNMYLLTQK